MTRARWGAMLGCLAVLLLMGGRSGHARAQTSQLQLYAGWNNIAWTGPAQPVTAALAAIAGQYDVIYRYDAPSQSWKTFSPRMPDGGDFSDLAQGAAYWIHMLNAATVTVGQAGLAPPSGGLPLVPGWNNFAELGPTQPVRASLASFGVTYTVVWHFDASQQSWQMYDPTAGAVSDFQNLEQGQAYFVRVVAPSPVAPGPPKAGCYAFQSYQPNLSDVSSALTQASTNSLSNDPTFQLAAIHVDPAGGPQTEPAYIPSTVLKAIAWIESGWRQATYSVPRGSNGTTITSSSCAFGLLQVLTGMHIDGSPTTRQQAIGADYLRNIAAGAQILLSKWNLAPSQLPVYGRRDPHVVEDWYFALWAYHCFGDVCAKYSVHNNPDDPALRWPRPMFASPGQQNSGGAFTAADYPYQELIFGLINNPPVQNGAPLWGAIPVALPPHGSIGFPTPVSVQESSAHLDDGQAVGVSSASAPAATAQPGQ